QRGRLAALGTAVTKINHDLRSILATARLVSDGLAESAAPEVRRVAPRLLAAIDRAVALCTRTLDFSREGAPPVAPATFPLRPLVEEVVAALGPRDDGPAFDVAVAPGFAVRADRDQLYRVLLNLARNAVEAGARNLRFSAETIEDGYVAIEVADDGPGLPPRAQENLFRPFFGSARPGGSGLGLAISRELMRAQGGDLVLVATTGAGTAFHRVVRRGAGGADDAAAAPGIAEAAPHRLGKLGGADIVRARGGEHEAARRGQLRGKAGELAVAPQRRRHVALRPGEGGRIGDDDVEALAGGGEPRRLEKHVAAAEFAGCGDAVAFGRDRGERQRRRRAVEAEHRRRPGPRRAHREPAAVAVEVEHPRAAGKPGDKAAIVALV